MKIQTGYLYHISNDFFDVIGDKNASLNHELGHSRPSYLAIKESDILWFIPLSSKIDKYQKIIDYKVKKYGTCKSIIIDTIAGNKEAILIQNAFPTIEKYVVSVHKVQGKDIRVSSKLERKIINSFQDLLILKKKGLNLFFTDIDEIKDKMIKQLKM